MKNLPDSYRFTRTVFGIIMILALFFTWGKYVVAILGVLFLISAATGFCLTCFVYNKIKKCKTCKVK
jgi:uncharacterized iron-regulated membrane protein